MYGYLVGVIHASFIQASMSNKVKFNPNSQLKKKSYKRKRNKGFSRTLVRKQQVVSDEERSMFFHSKGAGNAYAADLIEHLGAVFESYTPLKSKNSKGLDVQPSLTKITHPVHSRKGLRLLQLNPMLAKDFFNYNFLFKYVLTRTNIQHGSFSKQGSLTTEYLFRDSLSTSVAHLNLNPAPSFSHEIRRRLVKSFAVSKFTPKVTP